MTKRLYISLIVLLAVTFVSCEKEIIRPFCDKGIEADMDDTYSDDGDYVTRGQDATDPDDGGGITDPDEDEDYDDDDDEDLITDPDEDEDYDDDDDSGK